jgi:hypothetical protein
VTNRTWKERGMDWLAFAAILGTWIALQAWALPRCGVKT